MKPETKMLLFYLVDNLLKRKIDTFTHVIAQLILDPYIHFYQECFYNRNIDN